MTVLQILVVFGNSGIQMNVTAAPCSDDVWEELREEVRRNFEDQGAKVADYPTCCGNGLLADMLMRMPDNRSATSRMRIIGRKGDRWLAHIDILGPAAATAEAGANIEKVIDHIVVRRDGYPRTRLELLLVHLPTGAQKV